MRTRIHPIHHVDMATGWLTPAAGQDFNEVAPNWPAGLTGTATLSR